MPIGLPPILPPPGVLRATSIRRARKTEAPSHEDDDEPVAEVDAQIKILSSSLHPSLVGQLTARGISHSGSRHAVSPLHAGRDLTLTEASADGTPVNGIATSSRPAIIAPAPNAKPLKRPKARWHFGIRSRSPPMEVMLEIYKTLKSLGFEWRARPADETVEPPAPVQAAQAATTPTVNADGSVAEAPQPTAAERKKARKNEEERVKKAQELFLVETRCKLDDVEVRSASARPR